MELEGVNKVFLIMFCKMNWEDLNITITYSYLQLCQVLFMPSL